METIKENVADFPETTYPIISQANHKNNCQETEIMKRDPQRSEGMCQKGMPHETCQVVPLSSNKALYYQV